MLRVLDLFSGIGGFSLGLERAGMRTIAFCEIEPYCQAVLKKHWPNVPIFPDVTKLKAEDVGTADVICGGFPCQDISIAGKGVGIEGERSRLWQEFARLLAEIRPRYAIVENVPALRGRGIGTVLRDLAKIGYDAEWECIRASDFGARHIRERTWIIAYPHRAGLPLSEQKTIFRTRWGKARGTVAKCNWWPSESGLVRVVYGLPGRVDRVKSLGNAALPQITEGIGRAIIEFDKLKGKNEIQNEALRN